MDRAERRRQNKEDERLLSRGIDPGSADLEPTVAMARRLYALIEKAKNDRNIDQTVKFLYSKIDATLLDLRDVPVACKKGCSHCCNIWVSVSAPEVLFTLKAFGPKKQDMIKRIRDAHVQTRDYTFDVRDQHPNPCPLLKQEVCSIYTSRPSACRWAASGDANICARSYRNETNENIPTPMINLMGRTAYAAALVIALRHAGLPHHAYEFNSAMVCALAREDAEEAWLSGEDIFAGVMREPGDLLSEAPTQMLYELAFEKA